MIFAATAGLWGVMVTDMIQFCITMTSAFAAAYFAIHAPGVGGLHGLHRTFSGRNAPRCCRFCPNFGDRRNALAVFVIPIAVLWWSVWYPGAEPGGGSYVAQRMFAARSEVRRALRYVRVSSHALRPSPLALDRRALASTIVYPDHALDCGALSDPHPGANR